MFIAVNISTAHPKWIIFFQQTTRKNKKFSAPLLVHAAVSYMNA